MTWSRVIPMAALVAVMIIVAVSTFDWHSVAPATLKRMPYGETIVMLVTVAATLATHNLAIGVVVGVLAAMVIFARRVAHLVEVTSVLDPDGSTRIYSVHGELFFASSNDLVGQFDYAGDPDTVVIDMTHAHVWDASSVAALDAITTKYASPRQDRRDHRAEPAQRPHPRHPRRPARRRPLMATTSRDTGPEQHASGPATGRLMQIGEAAERVGLSIRTIRHYEEAGLIVPSARSEGGFRLYTEPDLDRLAVVKRMKPLGFTLDEMRDLLTVLDALDTATGNDRAALLDRLAMFHTAATTRVTALRDQLAMAEGFAGTLRDKLDHHGSPAG